MSSTYVSPRYLSCAETAKLVRAALKREFPGEKFSVRSKTYSGGASISIGWTDGPTTDAVDRVVGVFAGADFDGMIDMKTYSQHWLNPDGTVTIAHAYGTERSMGYLPEVIGSPQHPAAELVRFAADFVFSQREVSDAWRRKLEVEVAEFVGDDSFDSSRRYEVSSWYDRETGGVGLATDTHRGEWGSSLVHQLSAMRGYLTACDHATGTYPMGNGWHRCKGCGLRCVTAKAWRGR